MAAAIEIRNLSWQYTNTDSPALKHISLEIEENSFIGICGPNESGKTSLVSAIRGLIPANYNGTFQGEINIFGKNIFEFNALELAKYVGLVFADPEAQFTSMSVEEELVFGMENVGLPLSEIRKRIQWVSELTMIQDLLDKSPYDISGGQKQRVAIASILSMQPKILILDEPTSMLDPLGKDSIFEICRRMKEELHMTIIMVEHTIDRLARLSDKLLLLHDGEVKKYAAPADFFDDVKAIQGYGLNVPASMILQQKLRDAGLYSGEIKTDVNEVVRIAGSILEERREMRNA
jgi:energy-coupling factor transporter ATP-binding protein EcfA2